VKLSVVSGVIYAIATCRAGGAVAIETEDGECVVPRQDFEDLLQTFKGQRILTVRVKNFTMTIGNFKMSVASFSPTSVPPNKFEWFGPNPASNPTATASQKSMS